MRSIRKKIRKALLASTLAAAACMSSPSGVSTTTGSGTMGSSGSANAPYGVSLCAKCAQQGLVCDPWMTSCIDPNSGITASATSGTSGSGATSTGTTGSSGTTGACRVELACPPVCDCTSTTYRLSVPDGGVGPGPANICQCWAACPQLPDGGIDAGGFGFSPLTGCTAADAGNDDAGAQQFDFNCYYATECNSGRRPDGLCESRPRARNEVGAYFASVAHLEAASVIAFRRLARELRSLGAPESLITRARTAAREEIQHARLTRNLAARYGATPSAVTAAPARARSLEEFAIENAREGCVGETFGAALAAWQAHTAHDPAVRFAAASIHEDEAGHAELAWDIDAWLSEKLSPDARARVEAARAEAVRALDCDEEPGRELALLAGLPVRAARERLLKSLRAEIWDAPDAAA